MTEFLEVIKSPVTKRYYQRRLSLFFDYARIEGQTLKDKTKSFIARAKRDPEWTTNIVLDYMRSHKARAERGEVSEGTVYNLWKPINLLLQENDIPVNLKKISRRIPKGKSYGNDRIPTSDEVRIIISSGDRRLKPIILSMVSSGIRVGAWDTLCWGDVELIEGEGEDGVHRLVVYRGDKDEYRTFISPEAYRALKAYIEFREANGEKISAKSPLMRDLWYGDRLGKEGHLVERPQRLKSGGVKRLIEDALRDNHIRKPMEPGKKRYEFQAVHGLRKFFKTKCEANMKTLHAEILLGHNIGLNANYYRPREEELLVDYKKALPSLTILEKAPLENATDVDDLKKKVAAMEGQLRRQDAFIRKVMGADDKEWKKGVKAVWERYYNEVYADWEETMSSDPAKGVLE